MKINKEGTRIITAFCMLTLTAAVILFIFAPLWLAIAVTLLLLVWDMFVIAFFREPSREMLDDPELVYAPADGRIVALEEVEENEYFKDKRIQVSVFMSLTNVHINWFPVGGEIEYYKYHPGEFLVAWHPKSSEKNERTTVVVGNGRHSILFRQIAGYVARRIVSYAEEGLSVRQNQKCGFIKFGSRVDVFLPVGTEILVKPDDKVTGSQTPIARLR